MLSEDLQIYRDTFELCKQLCQYSQYVPKHWRYGEYGRAVSMSLDDYDGIININMKKVKTK